MLVAAAFLLLRANELGAGRSEDDVIIPAIGRRVTRPSRPAALPREPVPGGEA